MRILAAIAAVLSLPLLAQGKINIKPGEKLEMKTLEPDTKVGLLHRRLLDLRNLVQIGAVSKPEEASTREVMIKQFIKGLEGPMKVGFELASVRDMAQEGLITAAQNSALRKAILLVGFAGKPEPIEED